MTIVDKILTLPFPLLNNWGYWIILLSTLLEASPISFIVPGQTIVIIGGFFAKLGILDIGDVMLIAAVGAILGDIFGYLLGRKYGYRFISKYGKYLYIKKKHVVKVKNLMNHHAAKAIIIGRFNPLTRALAPFIAGLTKLKPTKFLVCDIIGGISWAVIFTLVGYIFGASYEIASKYINRILFVLIVLAIIIIYSCNKRQNVP